MFPIAICWKKIMVCFCSIPAILFLKKEINYENSKMKVNFSRKISDIVSILLLSLCTHWRFIQTSHYVMKAGQFWHSSMIQYGTIGHTMFGLITDSKEHLFNSFLNKKKKSDFLLLLLQHSYVNSIPVHLWYVN